MHTDRLLVALLGALASFARAATRPWRARRRAALALALALWLGALAPALAQPPDKPLILVATPEASDPLYESAVIVVTPLGGGRHVGFIVNQPSGFVLVYKPPAGEDLKVPVYIGGSFMPDVLFALVQATSHPGGRSVPLLPGLYAANEPDVLNRILADRQPARFVAGLVAWRAGELEADIDRGQWCVLEPDVQLLLTPPEVMWEELVRRCEQRRPALLACEAPAWTGRLFDARFYATPPAFGWRTSRSCGSAARGR